MCCHDRVETLSESYLANIPEGIFQAFTRHAVSNPRMEVQMSVERVCASHQWYMK